MPEPEPPSWPWGWLLTAAVVLAIGIWRWPQGVEPSGPTPTKRAVVPARPPAGRTEKPRAGSTEKPAAGPTEDAPTPGPSGMPPVTASCPIEGGVVPTGMRQVPRDWLTGASGYDDAMRQQQTAPAPMVVYFFTDWCGFCRQIDRELFPAAEAYLSRSVVRVRVNPEAGDAEKRLAERFRLSGYPSFFVMPAGSDESSRCSLFRRGKKREPLSPGELEQEIESRNLSFARRMTQEGYQRRQAGDFSGAITLLDRAVAAAPLEDAGWMQRAIAREGKGDAEGALADYAIVAAQRRDASAHERTVHLLETARRFDEAVACADEWLRRDPRSTRAVLGRARAHSGRGDQPRSRADMQLACAWGEPRACGSERGPS